MNMLELRRRAIIASAGGSFVLPTYTGSYTLHGDETQGYIELLTSGTLTLAPWVYDLFLCNGGNGGSAANNLYTGWYAGGGGYTLNVFGVNADGEYDAVIGAGGAGAGNGSASANTFGSPGGSTRLMGYRPQGQSTETNTKHGGSGGGAQNKANNGPGGNGGSNGGNGGAVTSSSAASGQGTTTRAFADADFSLYAGGGGGGGKNNSASTTFGIGGEGGGGNGSRSGIGNSGITNTGGGGGAGAVSGGIYYGGGAGGSGIILVRWGY